MSRVLVIKNANFAANRVAVVDISSGVPCTGIELAESTITVTDDDPVTIEYTVTPADTTDDVIWASSDETVAIVEDAEVTIVGIGTTTLTATCGSFSDTLTLTVDLYAVPDWYQSDPNIITDPANRSIVRADLGTTTASTRYMAAQNQDNSDYSIPLYNSKDNGLVALPIRIPNNCNKIHINASALYNGSNRIIFVNATEEVIYVDTVRSCAALSTEMLTTSSNVCNVDVSVPEGANGFVVGLRLRNNPAEGSTIPEAGASTNLSVHFLSDTTT